jgi:hypothetical protein
VRFRSWHSSYKVSNFKQKGMYATGMFDAAGPEPHSDEFKQKTYEVIFDNDVIIPHIFTISIAMMYPFGGDFDESDLAFADIYKIGDKIPDRAIKLKDHEVPNDLNPLIWSSGNEAGAYDIPLSENGNDHNLHVSCWIGPPKWSEVDKRKRVIFRVLQQGDNHVAAVYSVAPCYNLDLMAGV